MDDDFYALKWNTALVMRDPRTTVVAEIESVPDLLTYLKTKRPPDAVVVDAEYNRERPTFAELLAEIRALAPQSTLVCLSQYGQPETVRTAIQAGVDAFLVKNEVRMAIVPAILRAYQGELVVTPSVRAQLEQEFLVDLEQVHRLPTWRPNPHLTPQIMKSFWLRVFFGMRASLAAEELSVETATIERYVSEAYHILPDAWADDSYLFDLELEQFSPEDQAFLWFTLPPRLM